MNVALLILNTLWAAYLAYCLANHDNNRGCNGFFLCFAIDNVLKLVKVVA